MRASSTWYSGLYGQLNREEFPSEIMEQAAFCRIELGLHFLTQHFLGESVGVLQSVLNGYVELDSTLQRIARNVRHRMGDVARRGYWHSLLRRYLLVPEEWRYFRCTNAHEEPITDDSVFIFAGSARCPSRADIYAAALIEPLKYSPAFAALPAQAGKRYNFKLEDGSTETVQLPTSLPPVKPLVRLPVVQRRKRDKLRVSLADDLLPAAKRMDELLESKPEVPNRNWVERLSKRMWFSAVDRKAGRIDDSATALEIDGVAHIVGLMNSGKTTYTDVLLFHRVTEHADRVCVVVSSVADVYAKVSFLLELGIDAVPLIGNTSRGKHADRYWRTYIEESSELIPDAEHRADPAAVYANTACLLEPFRVTARREWNPLAVADFPCTGRLIDADSDKHTVSDCPLLPACPARKAYRQVASAQVWVTTAQCLISSQAEPADGSMRWFEAVQHHIDLLIVDEADAVQRVLDDRFVQSEPLVEPGRGWMTRMVKLTAEAFDGQSMAPLAAEEVNLWHTILKVHENAVVALNHLALSESGTALKQHIGDAPFTAFSLFQWVVDTLFGIKQRHAPDKIRRDRATAFYALHLQAYANEPLHAQGAFDDVVRRVTQLPPQAQEIKAAISSWLNRWVRANVAAGLLEARWFETKRGLVELVLQAAIHAARISTTFFELSTMYPSIRDRLNLPDEEKFWANQPPRDYRSIVPEAPMGNILAMRWTEGASGGASLQLLWVHGVGRWLLHHAHDLLACEDIAGPHVVLTSATSWTPGSSLFHIPIVPVAVLRPPLEDRAALQRSRMTVQPQRNGSDPIFVSGKFGNERHDALRQLVHSLSHASNGSRQSTFDELLAGLPEGRRKILVVVLSGDEAFTVANHINDHVRRYRARQVVPDDREPGPRGLRRKHVAKFGTSPEQFLVSSELSIQRGYNILNEDYTAAIGAVVYLTRTHPPPFDLTFPLSLVSELAISHLQSPIKPTVGALQSSVHALREEARRLWFSCIGRPVQFRALEGRMRMAFVANSVVPISQTTGRTIRGNQPTYALLCDSAFAPRLAMNDTAADNSQTSIVVAMDEYFRKLLTRPARGKGQESILEHAISSAVWEWMAELVQTNEPLGSRRTSL